MSATPAPALQATPTRKKTVRLFQGIAGSPLSVIADPSSKPLPGMTVTIVGFTNGANNGTFLVFSCNATTLVVYNASGAAETHAATSTNASGVPGQGNLYVATSSGTPITIQGVGTTVGAKIDVAGGVSLVLGQEGNPIDAGFLSPYSNADQSHGFKIGGIYDGTGANPGFLNWGLNAAGGHVLNLTMPDTLIGLRR